VLDLPVGFAGPYVSKSEVEFAYVSSESRYYDAVIANIWQGRNPWMEAAETNETARKGPSLWKMA
jgi:hypothetical protein